MVVLFAAVACSSRADEQAASTDVVDSGTRRVGDGTTIVPEGLTVTALAGGNGVLHLSALTLRSGPTSPELYVALENEGQTPACNAAVSVELFDHAQASMAAGIGGLFSSHFYRLTDGSDARATCVAPGEVSMASIAELPADLVIEDVGFVMYRCSYFALEVEPISGLALDDVMRVERDAVTHYSGALRNELDVPLSNPSVAVFPINGVGRPLGMAAARSTTTLAPGTRWEFETNAVGVISTDFVAYPAGEIPLAKREQKHSL